MKKGSLLSRVDIPMARHVPHQARARNPFVTLFLSLLVFVLLDGVIFRSGLYSRISKPTGLDNSSFYAVMFEKSRRATDKAEVLVVGNSTIENAFSIMDFEKIYPNAPIKFIRASGPASEETIWYYTLQTLDPTHRRYAAVLFPLESYKVAANGPARLLPRILLPFLSTAHYFELLEGDIEADMRGSVWKMMLFPSHFFALDIIDGLFDPGRRYSLLRDAYKKKGEWEYERYSIKRDRYGNIINDQVNTMEGFNYDAATKKAVFPPDLRPDRLGYIRKFLLEVPDKIARINTHRRREHSLYWLRKILAAYNGSPTKLIFLQLPRWPVQLPLLRVLPGAPDIRQNLPKQSNVIYIDENEFEPLERPHYFFDTTHLNAFGRQLFTEQLGRAMLAIFEAPHAGLSTKTKP